ncbi:MAG: C-terminal binding protein [Chloroflexota bacterium]|nr:C-terminal binding protein [Chloroflexota bacterium]
MKAVHTFFIEGFPDFITYEELLTDAGIEVHKTFCMNKDDIVKNCAEADGIIAIGGKMVPEYYFGEEAFKEFNKCKVIACMSTGYDSVDVEAATRHGICVVNVPDYCIEEVSDQVMALILGCSRKFYKVLPLVRNGRWTLSPDVMAQLRPVPRLMGQTLGLIGFGNIPRAVVHKARAFGMRVITYSPHVPEAMFAVFRIEAVGLDQLLAESDYVSMHAALTPHTEKMMSMEQFKKMKPTAYFINTARGGLVDEQALHTALTEGIIAGAGLDVLEPEPPVISNPLLTLDNVLVTGHFGHYSEESHVELFRRPWEEVARVLQGQWPRGLVNPEVKEKATSKWGTHFGKPL